MTTTGENRARYSATVEQHPSRFSPEYREWAARADAWAATRPVEPLETPRPVTVAEFRAMMSGAPLAVSQGAL